MKYFTRTDRDTPKALICRSVLEEKTSGIKIKRNAFERRLDRGRIPHVKIGGRRFIPEDVMRELTDKEAALRK